MSTASKESLNDLRTELQDAVQWSSLWLNAIERDGFMLTHIRQASRIGGEPRPCWLVRAQAPVALQEGFGLAPEVLFLAIHGEIQSQDLKRAADEVVQSGLRLDGNMVVISDHGATDLSDRMKRLPGTGQRVAWRPSRGRWPLLTEVLRAQLPTYDVFDEKDAVRGAQHVGRDEDLAALRTRVTRGDAVAVLGVRKVGKTSLVRALTDWLDPASGIADESVSLAPSQAVVVWIDAEGVIGEHVDDVAGELLGALKRRERSAQERPLRILEGGLAEWKAEAESILAGGQRLCVVIDEFDVLFEGAAERTPIHGLGRLFRLMRAWAQQHQGQFSLVMIGRDPGFLTLPTLDGMTSPLLLWCSPIWLGPLRFDQDSLLLRRLGHRVGLNVGQKTAVRAREWTGGHPMLHRQFGSTLWSLMRKRNLPWGADSDALLPLVDNAFVAREAVTGVARELRALLQERYPAAYELLVEIATSDRGHDVITGRGGTTGEGFQILKNFGVLTGEDTVLPEYLRWYLDHFAPEAIALRRVG